MGPDPYYSKVFSSTLFYSPRAMDKVCESGTALFQAVNGPDHSDRGGEKALIPASNDNRKMHSSVRFGSMFRNS